MNNFNFIKLLRIFSKKDLTEFDKFLRSPLYNNQSTLVRFFRGVKKYYPEFNHKKLSSTLLFQAVNPGKPFNSVLFRKYISSITKLAEEYLFVSRVSEDKYRKRLTMLEIYQRAGLNNLYNKKESEISGDTNVMNKINSTYFQNKMQHSEIRFNRLNKHTNDDNSLNEIIEYQLYLYLNFIMSYSNNLGKLHIYNYNFKIEEGDDHFKKYFSIFDKKFFEDAENLFTGEELSFYRLIKNDIKISSGDADGVSISKMRDNIFECRDLLSHNMQYYFIARLNNFCLLMNSKGKPGYKKILFENYKFIFDSGLYFSNDRSTLSISEYTGILLSALKVKEFTWAKEFIERCRRNNYLEDPENLVLYGNSFLSFYKSEFQKSINYCNRVNLNLFPLRMGMNKINLKSMYELGHFEEAKSFIINYKQYLNKNKSMSKTVILREINFLEYYLTLIKNTKSADKKYLKNIIKKLEPETNVADKEWLLSKLKQRPHQIL